jgi:hypothetical protein
MRSSLLKEAIFADRVPSGSLFRVRRCVKIDPRRNTNTDCTDGTDKGRSTSKNGPTHPATRELIREIRGLR